MDVILVVNQLVSDELLGVGSPGAEARNAINYFGREVEAVDLLFLVHDMVNETGILMTESVVILPPYERTGRVVQ